MDSDTHLQEALDEYNRRVAELEDSGTPQELLEAYINRGTVLMMMDYSVAAVSDFDEAVDMILEMESHGYRPDLGLFIRAYENRGQMCCGSDDETMASDYARIADRLPQLTSGVRYFKTKDIVQMCINCAEDLLDEGYFENSVPFLEKAITTLHGKYDAWAQNRVTEAESLYGEACEGRCMHTEAAEHYTNAILSGTPLYESRRSDNRYQLILDRVARGDIRQHEGDGNGFIEDYREAARLLEDMLRTGESDDSELYVTICQGIAAEYMEKGLVEDSEKYLIKAMKFSNPEMRKAMADMGLQRP